MSTVGTMQRPEKNGTDFAPCPEGQYQAVLVDVVDLGWQMGYFEGKATRMTPYIRFVWQVNENDEQGEPYRVYGKKMKWSFHENANLTKLLSAWITSKTLDAMLDNGESIESLIGRNALINVAHSKSDDGVKTWVNIDSIFALPKGMTPIEPTSYTRAKDSKSWPEKMPEHSAFLPYSGPADGGEPASNPNSNWERAQALPSVAPKPTQPTPAPAFEAIDGKTTVELFKMAQRLFGDEAEKMLDKQARELTKGERDLAGLSKDEPAQMTDKLREIKTTPAKTVVASAGTGNDGDDGEDPFALDD